MGLDEVFDSEAVTVASLSKLLLESHYDPYSQRNQPTYAAEELRAVVPESIAEALDKPALLSRRIGKCFAEQEGRRFGDRQWHVRRTGGLSHNAQRWKVFDESDRRS